MKILNVKGIMILVAILLAVQLGFGLVITPMVSKVVLDQVNKHAAAKISAGRISVWPLTLSLGIKDLKIFDPEDNSKKMVELPKASVKVSFIGLLRKRIAISGISASNAVIYLESQPDGSFNVQEIVATTEDKKKASSGASIFDNLKGKKDWFSRIYEMAKSRTDKAPAKGEEKKPEEKKITKEVQQLPRGRRVDFIKPGGGYLFEIGSMKINNATIHLKADNGQAVDITGGNVVLKGMGVDPKRGSKFDKLVVKGRLEKDGDPAGRFTVSYTQKSGKAYANVNADDIDLTAIGFMYDSSLPVQVNKGVVTLDSRTVMTDDKLDSKNSLKLTGQDLAPKGGGSGLSIGAASMPVICQAINQVDPLTIDFNITGTPDDPQFSGFQESLMKIIKPYMEGMVKKQGENLLKGLINKGGETGASGGENAGDTKQAVDAIKNIFKK